MLKLSLAVDTEKSAARTSGAMLKLRQTDPRTQAFSVGVYRLDHWASTPERFGNHGRFKATGVLKPDVLTVDNVEAESV